jgi:hypothetical protein
MKLTIKLSKCSFVIYVVKWMMAYLCDIVFYLKFKTLIPKKTYGNNEIDLNMNMECMLEAFQYRIQDVYIKIMP